MDSYFEKALDSITENSDFTADPEKYPDKLYKYRSFNPDYIEKLLVKQMLWASAPTEFDDKSDCFIFMDMDDKNLMKYISKIMPDILMFILQQAGHVVSTKEVLQKERNKFTDKEGNINIKIFAEEFNKELLSLPHDERIEFCKVIIKITEEIYSEEFINRLRKSLEEIAGVLQKTVKICSLTARFDNRKMWEDYADKNKGYVIEYTLPESILNDTDNKIRNLFPVEYIKERDRAPLDKLIINLLSEIFSYEQDSVFDDKEIYKQIFIKNPDYSNEEEWRMMSYEKDIFFPYITAVYAGEEIDSENFKYLKDICKRKGYKLYKQKFNLINGKMEYNKTDF